MLDDVTDNTWFRHYTLQLLTILAKQEREGTWTERSLPQTMTSDPSSPNLKKKKKCYQVVNMSLHPVCDKNIGRGKHETCR